MAKKVKTPMEWTTRTPETAKAWGEGPWQNEPDKIQWVDKATGLDCLMHRHPTSGHWCGYVGVPEGHPYFEKSYSECTLSQPCEESYCEHTISVDVHGGLTYAEFCQETDDESEGICHIPLPGRPHKVWWLGFDCAHAGDYSPVSARFADQPWFTGRYEKYRTRAYVKKETARLAAQLAAVASR